MKKSPFVMFHWFHFLEETISSVGIRDRPDLIWNSDYRVTRLNRDNKTALAAVSANRAVVLPLIPGKAGSNNLEAIYSCKSCVLSVEIC